MDTSQPKKIYLNIIGSDGEALFYFSRSKNSLVYGMKSERFQELEKLYNTYHKDGGGRFMGRSLKSDKRILLKWDINDKIPLVSGNFHVNSSDFYKKDCYNIRLKDELSHLQYNLWLYKPDFKKIDDLPKNVISVIRRHTIKDWPDFWVHIIIFKVLD